LLAGARRGQAVSAELRGILITLAAMLLFGLMDAASKFLSTRYPVPQIPWLRYVFTVPLLLLVLAPRGLTGRLRSARPALQVGRALLLVVEIGLVVWCFGQLPLADVHAVLLGEQVGPRRWAAVGAGFVGVLVVLRPGLAVVHPAAPVALLSVLLYALYQVLTRVVGRVDAAETSLLWQLVVGSLALSLVAPFAWKTPAVEHWPLFVVVAALGGLGHYCMIKALQLAPAVVVQPFSYTLLLWAVVIGYVGFGDLPDGWTLLGATVIVAAGTYTAVREHRLRGRADRPT
jgi:drug/metabolite transporter (DMT)-like permease